MDAQTQSRARLTMSAVEHHCRLLVEALDASLVELSPEIVRWRAITDPRRWLAPSPAHAGEARDHLHQAILAIAPRYHAAAEELERIIRGGAAGHDFDGKAALRDEILNAGAELRSLLARWLDSAATDRSSPPQPGPFPQYVHWTVPRADAELEFLAALTRAQGGAA